MSTTTNWDQQADQIQERQQCFWRPQHDGDKIAGRLIDVEYGVGKNGDSTVYTVETAEGLFRSFWGSSVLDSEIKRQQVQLRDVIGVRFHGWRKGKRGQYKAFGVKVIERGDGNSSHDNA